MLAARLLPASVAQQQAREHVVAQVILDGKRKVQVPERLKLLVGHIQAGVAHVCIVLQHVLARNHAVRTACTSQPAIEKSPQSQ